MGNCSSAEPVTIEKNYNHFRVGLDHFEIQRVLGKGGFGKVL